MRIFVLIMLACIASFGSWGLDTSFGNSSEDFSILQAPGYDTTKGKRVLVHSSGSIFVIGEVTKLSNPRINTRMFIAKLHPNGVLDTNFGNGGYVIDAIDADPTAAPTYVSDALMDGSDIYIVGDYLSHFYMIKYDISGTLDSAFGSNGKKRYAHAAIETGPAVTKAGNYLYITGTLRNNVGWYQSVFSVDAATGNSVEVLGNPILPAGRQANFNDIVVNANGERFVGGSIEEIGQSPIKKDFYVYRFRPRGVFSGSELALQLDINNHSFDILRRMLINGSGEIYGIGPAFSGQTSLIALTKFDGDLNLVNSFGNNGKKLLSLSDAPDVQDAIWGPSGNIYIAGNIRPSQLGGFAGVYILSVDADGAPRSSFAPSGAIKIPVATYGPITLQALAFGQSGNLLVLGQKRANSGDDLTRDLRDANAVVTTLMRFGPLHPTHTVPLSKNLLFLLAAMIALMAFVGVRKRAGGVS